MKNMSNFSFIQITDHHLLGFRDSGMVDTPGNEHPDSFHRADLEAALNWPPPNGQTTQRDAA